MRSCRKVRSFRVRSFRVRSFRVSWQALVPLTPKSKAQSQSFIHEYLSSTSIKCCKLGLSLAFWIAANLEEAWSRWHNMCHLVGLFQTLDSEVGAKGFLQKQTLWNQWDVVGILHCKSRKQTPTEGGVVKICICHQLGQEFELLYKLNVWMANQGRLG